MRNALHCGVLVLLAVFTFPATSRGQMPCNVQMVPVATFPQIATPSRYFYLTQSVIEYGPGTSSAAGSDRSVRFFTVLENEMTFTVGGRTNVYAAGKSFLVPPAAVIRGTNEGRTTTTRVFVSSLVPAVEGRTGASTSPRLLYSSRFPMGPLPEAIDVIQGVSRWDPGCMTGTHVMNEAHGLLDLTGVMSYEYLDGGKETYGPGQGAQMYVGRPGIMGNRGMAPVILLYTWLATPGKPLTSPWPNP